MLFYILMFVAGLIFGSFANALVWRHEKKITNSGRSMCPDCRNQISWYDNIPIFSYFILSGRCRHCKKKISPQYPIVESVTGLAFLMIAIFSTSGIALATELNTITQEGITMISPSLLRNILNVIAICALATCLIIIATYDIKTREIPDSFNIALAISAIIYLLSSAVQSDNQFQTCYYHLVAAMLAFLFFFTFVYFSKETWMGGGDAKMAFGMGLALGPALTFLAVLLASISGSVFGTSELLISQANSKNNKGARHEIPFGPFLALGTYVSIIFGPQIISWYVKMFLDTV